jgi:hypothetical protein
MGVLFSGKEKAICCILFLSTQSMAIAQPISTKIGLDPFSINTSGNTGKMYHLVLDWSVGESPLFCASLSISNWRLSFGFLQNDFNKNLLFGSLDSFGIQIKVGPNPFSHKLIIRCQQEGITITELHLIDLSGHTLYHKKGLFAGIDYYQEIILQKLNVGTCSLIVYLLINNRSRTSRTFQLLQN